MIEFLINNFQLSSKEAEIFSEGFEEKSYAKNALFIESGKPCNKIGFLEKGLMKCVLIGKEREVVDDFVTENQFVANYYSFLTHKPSSKDIVCIEDSVVRVIQREQLDLLSARYPFIESVARIVTEKLFIATHQKLEALRLLSAEERYLRLLSSNPHIVEKVPQYEIASYLNVSPETVSRIRKKLMRRS